MKPYCSRRDCDLADLGPHAPATSCQMRDLRDDVSELGNIVFGTAGGRVWFTVLAMLVGAMVWGAK